MFFTHRLESAKVSMGCPANFSILYLKSKKNNINDMMFSLMNEGMPISEMCEFITLVLFQFSDAGVNIEPIERNVMVRKLGRRSQKKVSIFPESQYPDTSYRHV